MTRIDELKQKAEAVRVNAHAPYSHFYVGAAILDEKGDIHIGCNVENIAYQGTCAERGAVAAMIAMGGRKIVAVAVVGGLEGGDLIDCQPCGGCRQHLAEFSTKETMIYSRDGATSLQDLIPKSFSKLSENNHDAGQ